MESSSMTTTTDSGGAASSSSPTNNNHNSSSTESLNGLKFGRKIYFEQEAGGASGSAGSTKKQRAQAHNQPEQPPRCQVEGCNVDLSDVKAYYSRHKVCAMHSKTPTVVVGGIQQRFCQQCSRFHQLPEFDQGKRSCRRRLAGHNERRRKPQPGSMLSQRYGRLSSSIYDNSSRVGGILMDFSACPRDRRDAWTATRTSERPPGNQTVTATGKFLQHPWQSNPENARSDLFQHGSSGGYPGPSIPPGECVTAVIDSRCALSLLSSQPWDSRNRGVETNGFMNTHGAPMGQSVPNVGTVNPFRTPSWGFKGNEAGSSSHHDMLPDLGPGQISQPLNGPYSGELELSQQGRRQQNMDLGNLRGYSRVYNSSQQNNWSL